MRKLASHEIDRLDVEAFKKSAKTPLILILDNVRSALNVGSMFRTADAFALSHVYLCGITARPPHRDILKTALGADESVDWTYAPTTLEVVQQLQAAGTVVYAIEQTEPPQLLTEFKAQEHSSIAIVLGNEVSGVEQTVIDVCDGIIEVPQFGTKHSLNVAVCAGIVVWDIVRQIKYS